VIISQTPLRISFAGGGTDLSDFYMKEDGQVVSTAIDKYIYIIIKERFDDKIYVDYSNKEIVDSVAEIKHDLVREAMRKANIEKGIEVVMFADIPSEGSGLGSSSTLTVGLLNAFYIYQGMQVTAEQLAREASEIEIEICGKPIGKQDQYIAAYGGMRDIIFKSNGEVSTEKIALSPLSFRQLSSELLLFYTNITRQSSDILGEQKANTAAKMESLQQLKALVPLMRKAIEDQAFPMVGELLHESWLIKKGLASKISNNNIDELYETARNAGALGGKIAGAGGGGFLLLYVPLHKQNTVRDALNKLRELPFIFEQDGSKIIFNQRRYPTR